YRDWSSDVCSSDLSPRRGKEYSFYVCSPIGLHSKRETSGSSWLRVNLHLQRRNPAALSKEYSLPRRGLWRKFGVQARLLLGPAGSGKTFRCLAEIRDALCGAAAGPPLLLIAPKQMTFQLERQLLADPSLPGYTRLHI